MKLTNMKIDPKEREKSYAESVTAEGPLYPWGLALHLDNDALDKLGTGQLPEVGGVVTVLAKAKVTSVSSNESEHGKHRSVSLQLTDIGIESGDSTKDASDVLYAKG